MAMVAAAAALALACSRGGGGDTAAPPGPAVADRRCVVVLHGKGQTGQPQQTVGDITYVRPAGNADGWGGRQWLYFPDDRYQEVRGVVDQAITSAGCAKAVIQGFSNGASAAARLYCRGETFGGRAAGYIVDDPVPDGAVEPCTPPAAVPIRLYWSGALTQATEGWSCASADWTCESGTTIGIERYARGLGTEVRPSIHREHRDYATPPEQAEWLARSR